MDVLDRITELREERKWSEYQLAEKSGLTQSTISSWYRKNMFPTIPSLTKICDAFGISMAYFFSYNKSYCVELSESQMNLLKQATKLDSKQYSALITFLSTLSE